MQRKKLLAVAAAGVLAASGLAACSSKNSPNANANANKAGARDYLTIGMPNGTQTENNNPFLSTSSAGNMAYQWLIYEPLEQFNPARPANPDTPWLASAVKWAADYKSVDITVRDNAKWSDGQALTGADVAYTFTLLKSNKDLNQNAIPFDQITATGNTVHVTFTANQYVNQNKIIAQTPIVPQHQWQSMTDPAKNTVQSPIGSGPYVLKSWTTAGATLDLRTDGGYWQSLPKVKEIRAVSYSGNDTMATALNNDSAEWSFVFIPNVQKVYEASDAAHHHVWAPGVLGIHGLWLNTTVKPYNDVKLRQAMNMVINRADIFNQAESGYFHPEIKSVTGLPDGSGDAFIAPQYKDKELSVDVAGAKTLLQGAGYKLSGSTLTDPTGKPVTLKLTDPAPWSDYQTSLELIASNLAQIGIKATVEKPNQDAWQDDVNTGNFQATMHWTNSGATPYDIYQTMMDGRLLKPIGQSSQNGNFGRFNSPQATQALETFQNATDDAARTTALNTLEQIFVEQVPVLPVGSDNVGMAYNDKYWIGWPSDSNPYSAGQPTQPYESLILQHLTPATS
jgi:peptide/nickel transport system substrate-binding protein